MTPSDFTADFLRQVSKHELRVIRDDGLYRHLQLSKPGSWDQHFDIVTWPGYLCFTGDMGTYTFKRLDDMLMFFRREPGKLFSIPYEYWAEKLESADKDGGITQFCPDSFDACIKRDLIDWMLEHREETTQQERRALWDAVMDEVVHLNDDDEGRRRQAAAHDFQHQVNAERRFEFRDFWEHDVQKYTGRFVWCCHALAWGIHLFDSRDCAAQALPTAA